MNEQKVRSYIRSILDEQATRKRKNKAIFPGEIGLSVGGGAFTKVVVDTGALAKKDPSQLMKNLGVTGGGSALQGVADIWKQASTKTEPMSRAFSGLSQVKKGDRTGLVIGLGELNARNAAKFVHHTLKGAMAAGLLKSDVPLQIQVVGGDVIIHTGSIKGDWE